MARRARDYKAEYAARTERAKKRGYSGYGQLRARNVKVRDETQRIVERLEAIGLLEFFNEDHDIFDTEIFWEAWRNAYGKGSSE